MAAPTAPEINKADLKKLLIRSKKEPVNCAVGMSKTQQALILLDKIKQPRAISKELEKMFGEIATPRWGTAFVDVDADPKLVILTLNKPTPGLARKMKKTLKGTGFAKVQVRLEDGTLDEAVDEEEEDDQSTQLGTSGPPDDSGVPTAQPPVDGATPSQAEPIAAPSLDIAGQTKRLTDLVRGMIPLIAADPSRQSDLKGLATQAQSALKSAHPAAQDLIDQLEAAIKAFGQAAPGTASGGASPDPAAQTALAAAPKAWDDVITKLTTDVGQLKDAIRKDFGSAPPDVVADIEKNLTRIDQVIGRFDRNLADLLHNAAAAKDGAARTAALAKARSVIADHIKYTASEPLIALIDDNPFGVSLGIKEKLASALTEVTGAIR